MSRLSRREFIGLTAAVGGASMLPPNVMARRRRRRLPAVPENEKLNIGCVGVGGWQGARDVGAVSNHNIYALCDVDSNYLGGMATRFPRAKTYRDYREMLDKEYKNLDAVTVTIPDHMHASVAMTAMERGLHVYCQKPLAQSIWECRQMERAAAKYQVVTQMGNQGYSCEATRLACEIIWSGQIGDVKEVHAMHAGGFARGVTQWPAEAEAPAHLDWDLWNGRGPQRGYVKGIHPHQWRGFQDYGTQMVGDWGVHMLGPANWALGLGAPSSVECTAVEGVNPVTYPHYSCKFEFPKRENRYAKSEMPAMALYWYEGNMAKRFKLPEGLECPGFGRTYNTLFVGTKGYMVTGGRGETVRLTPESAMAGFVKPERVLERSPGHFQNWLEAIKGGTPDGACSNFGIAAPFTEWLLLGTISWRFPNETLKWDGKKLRFTNNAKANEFVRPDFRKGWEIKAV